MNKKKILWVILLVAFIAVVVAGVMLVVSLKDKNDTDTNTSAFSKNTEVEVTKVADKEYTRVELDDGILYSVDGEKVKADIVLGDNYFDTTINDMYLNPESYKNKNIEIEGMYLVNDPYTFVGRYSVSNLCAYCPPGYSYMEYQLGGAIDEELVDQESWIKVVGTLKLGNDETTNYQDYYYLDVINFEIMNKKGQDTVTN